MVPLETFVDSHLLKKVVEANDNADIEGTVVIAERHVLEDSVDVEQGDLAFYPGNTVRGEVDLDNLCAAPDTDVELG